MSASAFDSTTTEPANQIPGEAASMKSKNAQEIISPEDSTNLVSTTEGIEGQIKLTSQEKAQESSAVSEIHGNLDPKVGDPQQKHAYSVNPIPATPGIGNPIHLQPGQEVPNLATSTGNSIQNTVRLDKQSYETGGNALVNQLVQPALKSEGMVNDSMFSVPPVSRNMIPESSLPIGDANNCTSDLNLDPFIQSAAPTSSTAQLAGQVPLEPRDGVSTCPVIENKFDQSSGPTIQSAAPTSSTAQLAGQVPLEPHDGVRDGDRVSACPVIENKFDQNSGPTILSAAPTSSTAQLAGQVPLEPLKDVKNGTDQKDLSDMPGDAAIVAASSEGMVDMATQKELHVSSSDHHKMDETLNPAGGNDIGQLNKSSEMDPKTNVNLAVDQQVAGAQENPQSISRDVSPCMAAVTELAGTTATSSKDVQETKKPAVPAKQNVETQKNPRRSMSIFLGRGTSATDKGKRAGRSSTVAGDDMSMGGKLNKSRNLFGKIKAKLSGRSQPESSAK